MSAGAMAAGVATRSGKALGPGAEIRIGLIGCGGRGTGAAFQAAAADAGVRIVALGDLFADQVASAAHVLARDAGRQFSCPVRDRFSGADAFRRVLAAGVDAVLIAAPPHLRPLHVEAAVAAGAHVFCETPAAIDVAGVRRVARALALARAAGLTIASGLHSRRDGGLGALVAQVRAGAIGAVRRVDLQARLGMPWRVPARGGWSSAELRLRNWISADAYSGGHFVERHVHALDRGLWVLGDRPPVVAEPLPIRSRDAVAVCVRFADGAELRATSVRGGAAAGLVRERVAGSGGSQRLPTAPDGRRFQATMEAFLRSIRSAPEMDDTDILVRASLVAIMGRQASCSGRPVHWEEMTAPDSPAFPVRQIGRDVNLAGV
jgi:predicted dehydrogenase